MVFLSDQSGEPGLSYEIDGQRIIIRAYDFRGSDDRLLREAIGMTVVQAWAEATAGAMDACAGLIWLMKRRAEPTLSYETVAESFGMREYLSVRDADEVDIDNERAAFEGGTPEAVEALPEAQGAN